MTDSVGGSDWICGTCGGTSFEHSLETSKCIWVPVATDSGSDELRVALTAFLKSEGLTDEPETYDSDIHSWRCSHPDIYGRCSCLAEVVDALGLFVERRVAEATERVKSLHFPYELTISGDNRMKLCKECSGLSGNAYLPSSQWPCATVRALASGQETSE